MKVVIIDDESKARSVLRTLINEECPDITEIFEAENLLEGVATIKKEEPKIVFLDIEMPEHSGLQIFDFINKDKYDFQIVFVTAYSEYALQAFELAAVDYLLKPIRLSQLREAIEKVKSNILKNNSNSYKIEELKNCLSSLRLKKVGLPHTNGICFVNYEDIIMLEADGMYTNVSLINNETVLVSKPLRYFLSLFAKIPVFYKPHRSFLINLMHLKQYIKKEGGYIVMDNDKPVSISKNKRDEFLSIVNNI